MARRIAHAEWAGEMSNGTGEVRSDLEGEIALEQDRRTRDIAQPEFTRIVEDAAANCPVSRALGGAEINVDARPAGPRGAAESHPAQPRAIDPRRERATREGRSRRAFEGQVVGRMRTQASERHASRR